MKGRRANGEYYVVQVPSVTRKSGNKLSNELKDYFNHFAPEFATGISFTGLQFQRLTPFPWPTGMLPSSLSRDRRPFLPAIAPSSLHRKLKSR